MRHMLNFRIYARGLPHNGQRLRYRPLNLSLRLTIWLALATGSSYFLKGIPMVFSKDRPSSSVLAEVTRVMFRPLIFSILS